VTANALEIVAHGIALEHDDVAEPVELTYAISDASMHAPLLPHAPDGHSPLATHFEHAPALQIGSADGQSFMPSRHSTQLSDTQNWSLAICPKPGHSPSPLHAATHPRADSDAQYGIDDEQSAPVVQVVPASAMTHSLPLLHDNPTAQMLSVEISLAAQSAASLQQRFGLGRVHAATKNKNGNR
jgi:hypothetical protein